MSTRYEHLDGTRCDSTEQTDLSLSNRGEMFICGDHDRRTRPVPDEDQHTVTWTLTLDDAEELYEYLHNNRPGGYQHVHDGLRDAIAESLD